MHICIYAHHSHRNAPIQKIHAHHSHKSGGTANLPGHSLISCISHSKSIASVDFQDNNKSSKGTRLESVDFHE